MSDGTTVWIQSGDWKVPIVVHLSAGPQVQSVAVALTYSVEVGLRDRLDVVIILSYNKFHGMT